MVWIFLFVLFGLGSTDTLAARRFIMRQYRTDAITFTCAGRAGKAESVQMRSSANDLKYAENGDIRPGKASSSSRGPGLH